jgi:hypothetical protein
MARPDTIYTTPKPPSTSGTPPRSSGGGGGGGGGSTSRSSGGSSGGGGGGGSSSGISGAERRATARENKAKRDAANRFLEDARTLQRQINAMRVALGPRGLRRALDTQLRNVNVVSRQADTLLRKDYRERVGSLRGTAKDNAKDAADQTYANLSNRGRERANALSEATLQGAGESDLLRTQGMSLRNWNANQHETNRAFYDTLRSVNSSLTDLTVDTRTARVNNQVQANADRNQLWTDYYGNRAETLTQISNLYGEQANQYSSANEMVASGKTKKKRGGARNQMASFATKASTTSGMAWKNPGVKASIRNWEGAADIEGHLNNDVVSAGVSEIPAKKPEGATLRSWAG